MSKRTLAQFHLMFEVYPFLDQSVLHLFMYFSFRNMTIACSLRETPLQDRVEAVTGPECSSMSNDGFTQNAHMSPLSHELHQLPVCF